MLHPDQIEELICLVSALDRPSLVGQFTNFRGTFPVDFSRDFLEAMPVDRLRHIFVALCLQTQRFPEFAEMEMA